MLHFKDCDEIWHAGDFGNADLVSKLTTLGKPLRGVWGNIDGKDVYVVSVTSPSGTVSKKYYDATTGFKLKDEVKSDEGDAIFMYGVFPAFTSTLILSLRFRSMNNFINRMF